MQKDERSLESSQNGITRRHFMGTVAIGLAGSFMLISCDSSDSVQVYDTTGAYKKLYNALNASKWHFAPPDGETPDGKKFDPLLLFFQTLFQHPANEDLINTEFKDFKDYYKNMWPISQDILAMIFSVIGDESKKKTIEQITEDLHQTYPGYGLIGQVDVFESIDKFFSPFGLVGQDENDDSLYYAYPFVFEMGDANYAILATALFNTGAEHPEWGKNFFTKLENYLFDPSKAFKLFQHWQPPRYRIIPAQFATSEPGTDLFETFVQEIPLHDFDVMKTFLNDNGIESWQEYTCGCVTIRIQKDQDQAVFANWFSDDLNPDNANKFDISLRNTKEKDFNDNMDDYDQLMARAEDKFLPHLVYNVKKGGADEYNNFMCHCHLDWCIELRPRNMYWDEPDIGEDDGNLSSPMQRALYDVQVIPGACGTCRKCYNESPYKEENGKISQVMYCPAGAISKASEGIAIDGKKCLGCLLCVRNCFRVRQSTDIALTVTRMPEGPKNGVIPKTNADMVRMRDENASKLKWTRFRYDVG
ncbi:MAG: hypothetical protein GY846_16380 [Deltaproteobacteria bacterium]|nr:hypothetical protein [Deltaproteobacteria bacterium]